MSSYVVDDITINRITSYLNARHHQIHLCGAGYALKELGIDLSQSDDLERLGAAMFSLNVAATSQRYRGESIETLPGTVGHYEYTHHWAPCDTETALEELTRWLYQCCEGTATETPLYRAFDHAVRIAFMRQRIEELTCSSEPLPSIWTR